MKKILYFSVIIISLFSCQKEIDMQIENKPKKLVINAWFKPDSLFSVHIGLNKHILEKEFSLPGEVLVFVYENGIKIDTLHAVTSSFNGKDYFSGEYRSFNKKPDIGKTYKIEAISKTYGIATAEGLIPDSVPINSLSIDTTKIELPEWQNYYVDENGDTIISYEVKYNINISIKDPSTIENFYMLYLEQIVVDSLKDPYNYKYNFEFNSSIVEFTGYSGSLLDNFQKVDDNDEFDFRGYKNNNASVLMFSDAVFNGKNTSMDISVYRWISNSKIKPMKSNYELKLASISKDYYHYIISMSLYSDNTNPFVEPVQVFMNIKNGYGVFLTSSESKRSISF